MLDNSTTLNTIKLSYFDVPWSSELFEQSAGIYNPKLAIASIAMCSDKYTDDMQRLGFHDYQHYRPADEGIPGFAIGQQSMTIKGEEAALIAVFLQGTGDTAVQWMNDLKLRKKKWCGYRVHSGFRAYANEVWDALNSFLSKRPELPAKKKLLLAGHSAGGAGVNLLAVKIAHSGDTIIEKDSVYAYAFAVPHVIVDKAVDVSKYDNIFNINNVEDIVPKSPYFRRGRVFGKVLTFDSKDESGTHDPKLYIRHLPNAQFVDEMPRITIKWFFRWFKRFLNFIKAMKGSA